MVEITTWKLNMGGRMILKWKKNDALTGLSWLRIVFNCGLL